MLIQAKVNVCLVKSSLLMSKYARNFLVEDLQAYCEIEFHNEIGMEK
jgi:hypothetical protein